LDYLENSGNYNKYNNKTTLKNIRSEDYFDDSSNYDNHEDARALMYQRKQNNKNINNKYKFIECYSK